MTAVLSVFIIWNRSIYCCFLFLIHCSMLSRWGANNLLFQAMGIWIKRSPTQNASSISRPDSIYEIMGFLIDVHGCLGGDECILCMRKIWIIKARGWNMVDCSKNGTQWITPSYNNTLGGYPPSWDFLCQRDISTCDASRVLISIYTIAWATEILLPLCEEAQSSLKYERRSRHF